MSLEGRIAALEEQIQALKDELASQGRAAPPAAERVPAPPVAASRRQVLRRAGAAAAGAMAAGTALALTQASPAAADASNALILGESRSTTGFTSADYTGLGSGAAFVFRVGASGTNAGAAYPAALGGFTDGANGVASGVYGYSRRESSAAPEGYGIAGVGDFAATGVLARSSQGANLELYAEGAAGPARATPHKRGQVVCDANGHLWFCTVSGSPGQWRRLSSPAAAGQLHLLGSPVRVYDSRSGAGPASTGDGPLASGSSRLVSVASGFVGNTGTTAVPAGGVAVLVNIAAANTVARGFLAVYNAAVAWPGHANLNWTGDGTVVSNQATSLVDNLRRVEVRAGGSGAATDFIVDVVGYYR